MKAPTPESDSAHEAGFTFGEFRLEPDGTLLREDVQVHLPAKELAALRLLLQHAGQIVTPEQLRKALWSGVHVTADSVPRCISSLRARLEADECIQTVYKQGYRLTWAVERYGGAATKDLPRLAIVPFGCGPNVPEHLGHAVAEEATARLTALTPPVFAMVARDSVFTLAKKQSALQVGETLKADLVLTGTVQALPAHFRLRAEMVRVKDGTQTWVEDVLVARERAGGLEGELVERLVFRAGGSRAQTGAGEDVAVNAQAYDLFLRGRYEWQSLERQRMQEGIRHLRRAAELDGGLAQARVELVRACVAQELFGYMTPRVAADEVRSVAAGFAEGSAEREAALPALGWMAFHVDRDVAAALGYFEAAARTAPDSWRSRLGALFAAGRHRFDESAELLLEALEADPCSAWVNGALAWTYHLGGRAAESRAQIERCLELCPDHTAARLWGGMILAYQGETRWAVELTSELARHAPQFDMAMAAHAYALARAGEREKAEEWLERLEWLGHERYVMRSFAAAAWLAAGNREQAIAELKAADEDRCPWFLQLLADPRLEALEGDAEFAAMRARAEAMESGAERAEAGAPAGAEAADCA